VALMMETSLKRYAPIAAGLGLAGLVLAAGAWLLQRQFTVVVQATLAVGLLGLAVAMLLNPGALQTWLGGRQARYGGNVLVMVLALIGILVLVNYLAVDNPQRWDWSEGQLNTLAPESLEAVRQLPAPVQAIGFYTANFASSQDSARNLLEQYRVASDGQLTYEFHDPVGEPVLAQQYDVTRDGTLILVMGEQREELSFASEDQISGALIRLANPTPRTVYFLSGHGERPITSTEQIGLSRVADLLDRQNYVLQPVNLAVTTTVPADARAVVVAGPQVPVTQEEVNVLKQYVDGGGSLVVMVDSLAQTTSDYTIAEPLVEYLAADWGVRLGKDVVVDFFNSYPNQPLLPLNAGYGSSAITDRLQGISTVFPGARTVQTPAAGTAPPNLTYTALVPADGQAWGETNFESLNAQAGPQPEEADTQPPVNLAVAVENSATGARLVVFGDSDFATNDWADQGANANLLANSVNWVTVEESLINLTPKTPTTRTLALTNAMTGNFIFLLTVVLMPLAVLVLGGVVWFQRRRHV
jgi:ABC-type uncharacterized transport system involved in gliding motility auxiliary subunit